jgi:FAD dependent oxidoreductase TIGR03364
MMDQDFDLVITGAGIVGLAHAYHAARAGLRVCVYDRSPRACGASVRNFGMIWPVGQPDGDALTVALASRGHWQTMLRESGLWHDPCGSMHLAYHDDEAAVLGHYADRASSVSRGVELLSPRDAIARAPWVNPKGLVAGVFSPSEICVDPRQVIAGMPKYLSEQWGVTFRFGTAVTGYDADAGVVRTGEGPVSAGHLLVCPGDDLQTLYAPELAEAGLMRCKLQMMRSTPAERRVGPMLAAGLTLLHYKAFAACPGLSAVRERVLRDMPDHVRYGIHVMTSQNGDGEIVIGDSHEYGDAIEPFDKPVIDRLVLEYLNTFVNIPNLTIGQRWHGTYAKHAVILKTVLQPEPNVTVVTGLGGAGMTFSFGVAERVMAELLPVLGKQLVA